MSSFNKPYDPKEVEEKIYKLWEKSGYFDPDKLPGKRKKSFTIIMPPPNANGLLHVGHAIFVTLQDIMIRYRRMKGDKTLWLPGADHAGFETQVVFDKKLEKEGRNRFHIPREQLYKEMLDFTLTNKKNMENQLRKLGASCDWSREKFTLDENIIKIVYETFEKLKKDDLIYQGQRIVNWCSKHQTSLSNLEIKYEEKLDKLYYVKYKLVDSDDFVEVATTRPETIPADIAIAVHPKSKWNRFVNQKVINPLTKKEIIVLADKIVDLDFGTGALKITPFHDAVDFSVWNDHRDEIKVQPFSIIDKFGKMNEKAGVGLQGLKIKEAREKSVEFLRPTFSKEPEDYKHQVAVCYKCGSIIEPMVLDNQWFIKMTAKPKSKPDSLRDAAVKAVRKGEVKFIPKRFEKIFFYWMKNLRDWNISRQIPWGIKIPEKNTTDVFDTWFSSGQWPFATLMTTKKDDFKTFYPTDVMETGWDILFFWVARMIILGIYVTGKIPFKYVYLHGLVRDKDRQKMSKSKGNVIDPLGVVDLYGADALRMALIIGNAPGNDPIIYEEKIKGYRNFANKIWQASRFILMNTEDFNLKTKPKLKESDKKILKELSNLEKETTRLMDSFKFYTAGEKIYHYFWHTFADKIIESAKPRLKGNDEKDRQAAQYILLEILKANLKLLHPFMPFITEEIYQKIKSKGSAKLLMIEKWR